MFGKKSSDKVISDRLQSIKSAAPVRFAEMHRAVESARTRNERAEPRRPVYRFGLLLSGKDELPCVVRDISEHGAHVVMEGKRTLPREFRLVIDGYGAPADARLRWQKENEAGVAFP